MVGRAAPTTTAAAAVGAGLDREEKWMLKILTSGTYGCFCV